MSFPKVLFPLLILLILLFSTGKCMVSINPGEDLPLHKDSEPYYEKKVGETLQLTCETHGIPHWILPDNRHMPGFDSDEVRSRTNIAFDVGEAVLEIKNLKQSDTGRYKCVRKNFYDSSIVYVYVRPNQENASVFLLGKSVSAIRLQAYGDSKITIPCKTNKFIGTGVKLLLNGRQEENAIFDPRDGFTINAADYLGKIIPASCQYGSDHFSFLLIPVKKAPELKISVSPEQPALNQTLTLKCIYNIRNLSVRIEWKCPQSRCDGNHRQYYQMGSNMVMKFLEIEKLQPDDVGTYKCAVINNERPNEAKLTVKTIVR